MKHGTESMYVVGHCRCEPCSAAKRRSHKIWTVRTMHGERPLRIPKLGVIRRIHALQAIGWRTEDIARELGHAGRQSLAQILFGDQENIHVDTAGRIDAAYQRLSGKPGPSLRTRNHARRKGWAPPLAWSNIDDPDEIPNLGEKPTVRGADIDEWLFLIEGGEHPVRAASRMGVTIGAIEKAGRRAGRPDVYEPANRLRQRERNVRYQERQKVMRKAA